MNLNTYNENQDISSADEEPKTALQIYKPGSVNERVRGRDAIRKNRRSKSLSNDKNGESFTDLKYQPEKNQN